MKIGEIIGVIRIWSVAAAIALLSCCPLHRAVADAADGSGTGAEVLTQVATSINRGRYEFAISQIDAALKQTAEPDQSLIYLRAYGRDGTLGYRVEDVNDAGWIEHDGVGFRDFLLRKV